MILFLLILDLMLLRVHHHGSPCVCQNCSLHSTCIDLIHLESLLKQELNLHLSGKPSNQLGLHTLAAHRRPHN